MEGRRQVRQVMLHLMHLAGKALTRKGCSQVLGHAGALALVAQAVEHHAQVGPFGERVGQLLAQVGLAVLVYGHMLHLRQGDAGFGKAVANRLAGETRPVLDAPKALFFSGGQQHAIAQQAGG